MNTKETEGNSNNWNHEKCGCGYGGMYGMHGGHRHWKYVVIKILVALFIFWCGVQFGELKALVRGGYSGYGMMGGYPSGMMYRGY